MNKIRTERIDNLADFPHFKQVGNSDCGPTCLRMVAHYYGKMLSEDSLRNIIGKPRGKFSALDLSKSASNIGLVMQGMKITFEQLCQENLPCIVHWNENHFVVVYKIRRVPSATRSKTFQKPKYSKYIINVADPADGLLSYSKYRFMKGWLNDKVKDLNIGIALLIRPDPKAKI